MTALKTAHTPDGFVVREIFPTGERAYRKNLDGSFAATADHKGPWVMVNAVNIPADVLHEIAKAQP